LARPPLTGLPRINTTPFTDAQRRRLHPKKVKPPKLFPPTVQKVKEIVPNKIIPKVTASLRHDYAAISPTV